MSLSSAILATVLSAICRAVKGAPRPTRTDASIHKSYPMFHISAVLTSSEAATGTFYSLSADIGYICVFLFGEGQGGIGEEVRSTQWRKT